MPFNELGLAAQINQAVKDAGYTEPTPIQTAAIPVILQRHDLMGIAQGGCPYRLAAIWASFDACHIYVI